MKYLKYLKYMKYIKYLKYMKYYKPNNLFPNVYYLQNYNTLAIIGIWYILLV